MKINIFNFGNKIRMSTNEKQYLHALEQVAEVKRILGAVEHASKIQIPATLLVTSASQNEGKSLFAAALATIAAKSGKYRVALLDFNWHRPSLHHFFDLLPRHSANTILGTDLSSIISSTNLDSLEILTAPTDYANHAFPNDQLLPSIIGMIEQAKKSYDLVIIDSAAIFPTNRMMMDPVILSGISDGVIMVILSAATPKQQVRRAQKTMEIAGGKILGVISNQWRMVSIQ